MLCSASAIPRSWIFSFSKLHFLFIWPTKHCPDLMPWLYVKTWHLIYRIALPQLISCVLLIPKGHPHPSLHIRIYIVQSNQPQLQVSVKEGDILFSLRGKRVLQFQRSCYLPSISVSSLNQNIIPQKLFTYVGHCLLSHTSLCFINLYNQILL